VKRPSFQFYPGDWLNDINLRSCSLSARGLWIDLICLMHQCPKYGHLMVNHKVIPMVNLARMLGVNLTDLECWMEELECAGVFSRNESGCIYSRRMIKDENLRNIRANNGKLGGNPTLKSEFLVNHMVNHMVNHTPNHSANQKPTPSSSSSSSKREEGSPHFPESQKPSWKEFWEYCQSLHCGLLSESFAKDKFEAAESDNWEKKSNWKAYARRCKNWWQQEGSPMNGKPKSKLSPFEDQNRPTGGWM